MFDSDDEMTLNFPEVGVDNHPTGSYNRNQPLPPSPRQTSRRAVNLSPQEQSQRSSSSGNSWQSDQRYFDSIQSQHHQRLATGNSRQSDQRPFIDPSRSSQSYQEQYQRSSNVNPKQIYPNASNSKTITIPEADVDPFVDYQYCIKLNGFIITNDISNVRPRIYSFMVFCQEDQKIYGVPKSLTTPPRGIKLNDEQKWRKKRDLEFGRKIDFIIDQKNDVLQYAKGSLDSVIAENIDGKNCFQVQCVLNSDLMEFYCVEFGHSKMQRPLKYHISDLAYECQVTFNEEAAIKHVSRFEIYKVIKACADQSVISTTPWIINLPKSILTDNDIEEMKNPDNYKANVTGIRYANDRVLHLRAENQVKIIFCTDFDNLPPIGSIFQFDYVFHPIKKLAVVAAVIRVDDYLEIKQIESGQDDESDYMFEICLNISEHKNGFFHHDILGMITDTKKCLRFAPYCTVQRPSDEINVRVKACLRQPALFDIVEICEDFYEIIEACEPPFVQTDCLMINLKSGKVFSHQYPGLDLRIDKKICKKFRIGELITGTFYLQNPNDFRDNRYISGDAFKMDTEPLRTLPITDDYALVVQKLRRITYTAPVSKKQMKKNPQAEDIPHFRQYTFFLQDYFEATHAGLIGGSKGRVSSTGDYTFSILETCVDGGQYTFNYVSKYDEVSCPLDLERNAMLRNHVSNVLKIREGINGDTQSRHSSISAASISSRPSSSIASSRSSSSIALPLLEDDEEFENSSRTTTPIADDERYSEMSTHSLTSNSVRSQRFQSPSVYSEARRTPIDQYSQNGDRHSRIGYEYERGESRISTTTYATASSTPYHSPPLTHHPRSNLPPEPRHQYGREAALENRFADAPPSSRLPPTSTGGRVSAQLTSNNRVESRPDSAISAPAERLPPNPTWSNRPPPSNAKFYGYENGRVEIQTPEIHPRSNGSSSSRVGMNHLSQNSLVSTNGRVESRIHHVSDRDVTERMNNIEISNVQQPRREPFQQLGGPRYRNMCLYRRSENISPELASILAQMDALLTNPPRPITISIRKKPSEINMPEFEEFVAKLMN